MRPTVLVVATALVAVLAGCNSDDDALPTTVPDVEPGFEHVHGLGVNPADGQVYAATHFGLWRADDGELERVGEGYHDLMGFTVLGDDHFAASGHPFGGGRELPPHLGLIVSEDGGETWRSEALLGEADFHALRAVDGTLYGYDGVGGRLMVSDGGQDWSVRGSGVSLVDLAVDPDDSAHLLASSSEGQNRHELRLVRSDDGGRSWEAIDGPAPVRLSWAEPGRLFAVDVDGVMHRSDDAGASWQEVADLPELPGALLDHEGRLYADASGRLVVSADDGASWETFASAP